jgi:hypothetical protein
MKEQQESEMLKPKMTRFGSGSRMSTSRRTIRGMDAEAYDKLVPVKRSIADRLIISESSRWKAIFDILMLFLVAYSWFTSVFYVAFESPRNIPQIVFDWVVEAFFILDLIFNFFQEYKDSETYENVRDHRKIAKKYILKGNFFIDFIAIFPFVAIFKSNALLTKLFRLFRLPRLTKLISTGRVNQLFKSFFENSSRDDKIVAQHIIMYWYKIFRLIIIAIIITYFLGWFWYFISDEFNSSDTNKTFVKEFNLEHRTNFRKLIVSCYFALTTLSTVGYGDYYPISALERVLAWLIMLWGVAFFSYIMGNFIEIVSNYNERMGIIDRSTELHKWMTMLSRFTNNKPLPRSLFNKIDDHFNYFWANDRLASTSPEDELMNTLPRSIKRTIMTNYLFQDVFYKFKEFFNTYENIESKFLYDVSFGFMPRKFEEKEVIYDEEDEVPEIYFIMEGTIGVGFRIPGRGLSDFRLIKFFREDTFIWDHYIWANKKSEFVYQAVKETQTFALKKTFLAKLFEKYPQIGNKITKDSYKRYIKTIREPLHEQRIKDIEDYNEK